MVLAPLLAGWSESSVDILVVPFELAERMLLLWTPVDAVELTEAAWFGVGLLFKW